MTVPTPPPRTTSLIQDACGMIDKPPPKLQPKQDLDLKRKILNPGQATERQNTLDPGQATERQTTLGKKFKATEIKGSMIENATRFLDKATEQMTRDAENKLKWEKVKNTPRRGLQKSQHIPQMCHFAYYALPTRRRSTIVPI